MIVSGIIRGSASVSNFYWHMIPINWGTRWCPLLKVGLHVPIDWLQISTISPSPSFRVKNNSTILGAPPCTWRSTPSWVCILWGPILKVNWYSLALVFNIEAHALICLLGNTPFIVSKALGCMSRTRLFGDSSAIKSYEVTGCFNSRLLMCSIFCRSMQLDPSQTLGP